MDHLCFFVSCVSHGLASVPYCLVVTCCETADPTLNAGLEAL